MSLVSSQSTYINVKSVVGVRVIAGHPCWGIAPNNVSAIRDEMYQ